MRGLPTISDKPLRSSKFESRTHTSNLLCGLENLRGKGHLLDVTLVVEGQAFQAHRVVLASCSDYFRAMFTDPMLESRQPEIYLNGVSAQGMRLLLEYAYSARLSLNLANIQNVLSAASHVQFGAVVEACSHYLQVQLDLENCVDIATLAETYSLHQLQKHVYRFICTHLVPFSTLSEFQRLSTSQLERILSCDYPVDCSEEQVFTTVVQWILHDKVSRFPQAHALLKYIRFKDIPARVLKGLLCGTNSKTMQIMFTNCMPLYGTLLDPQNYDQPDALSLATSTSAAHLVNARGMEIALVKVGGFGAGGVTNDITYYLPSLGKWRHLTTIPHVEQCNFGTAVLDNELFVVGGCFNQSLQENIHPFGFRYSPRHNKWTPIAPMQRERCRFTLTVVQHQLYAIGGAMENGEDMDPDEGSPCEKYDPVSDAWTPIPSLPRLRTQHAATALDHYLFVTGGLEHDFVLDSVQSYNVQTGVWDTKAPMLSPRADHHLVTYKNKVYVCGGWKEDDATRVLVDTIEVYDVQHDAWEVVARIPSPRYHAGVLLMDNQLFLIGGFHSDVMFDRATGMIDCFNLDTGVWTTQERYPQDIWEHACVTLHVPWCREDMDVMSMSELCHS